MWVLYGVRPRDKRLLPGTSTSEAEITLDEDIDVLSLPITA